MATLASLVQALPAELYNKVLELTFTADRNVHEIDRFYVPPKLLQVSRNTRAMFARSYYGNGSQSDSSDPPTFYASLALCSKWIGLLTQAHVDLLQEVRISDQKLIVTSVFGQTRYRLFDDHRCFPCVMAPSRLVSAKLKIETMEPSTIGWKWKAWPEQ